MLTSIFSRVLAGVVLLAAAFAVGLLAGREQIQDQWDAEKKAQTEQEALVKAKQTEATSQVLTRYVDREKVIREKSSATIQEVQVYVPFQSDASCIINNGFVRLHDAAAAGKVPIHSGTTDASPSGIALSTTAATVSENYGRCHENAARLEALQEWVRAQHEAGVISK